MKTVIIIPYVRPMYDSPDTLGLALASIRRFFKGKYEVRVVGQRPEDIEDDDRVLWMDISERGESQHTDMVRRIIKALDCDIEYPDEFVLWHDDMFAVNEVNMEDLRKKRAITDMILSAPDSDNYFLRDMHYTLEALRGEGVTYFYNYTIHCPVVYDTLKFEQMVDKFDLTARPLDFEMLYFHLNGGEPEVLKGDNNDWRLMMDDLHKPPLDRPVFIGLNNRFSNLDYLEDLKKRIM